MTLFLNLNSRESDEIANKGKNISLVYRNDINESELNDERQFAKTQALMTGYVAHYPF